MARPCVLTFATYTAITAAKIPVNTIMQFYTLRTSKNHAHACIYAGKVLLYFSLHTAKTNLCFVIVSS